MPVQASSALVRCGRPAASASLHPHPERSKPTRISRGARDADWRGCLSRAVPFRSDGRHQVMPFASWPRRLAERASFSVGNREAQAEPVELSQAGSRNQHPICVCVTAGTELANDRAMHGRRETHTHTQRKIGVVWPFRRRRRRARLLKRLFLRAAECLS